ncbi:3-hydroxyisobutyrate dehydrogenase [Parvularcula sp. IMCC14364]|uniref:3-hydroxyisobutyrate dehydrogenase n=1 Tax=Parvularcula sp. IMCC14364 TaxID=3067902 RepID=UPI002742255B|nr:3-hydroxyisobutyrate dehydrogenase [Parvularcula sp. IMCC14364]
MSTILFIGLGNMGSGMAANLVKAGHDVYGCDLSDDLRAAHVAKGGNSVDGALKDFDASAVDAVITMLPAGKHVAKIYMEDMAQNLKKGSLLIDCSTIAVDEARALGQGAVERGYPAVDAPVSGGVAAAEAGTLTFMVGGAAEHFEMARPFLEVMGKNVFHAGASGNGQVAKVCNNMLLAISMIGTCEAFNLAEKLGLDAQTFYDISSTASGQSWSMTSYCPAPGPVPAAPSNRDYQPGFATAMMLKDLRLAQGVAEGAKASIPLGSHAAQIYTMMEAADKDDLDFSGVMKLLKGTL